MHRFIRFLVVVVVGACVALLGIAGGALGMTEASPGIVGVYTSADSPYDVAVNAEGDVWVAYPYADVPRIARLNAHGVPQVSVPLTAPDALPLGIATDAAGNAYVADSNNDTILVYSKSGTLMHTYTDTNNLNGPVGLDVSPNGTIYVADAGYDRIDYYSSGTFTGKFGEGTLSIPNDLAVD